MSKNVGRAFAATFTLGASELLRPRPFGADPGEAADVAAIKAEETVEEKNEERKRRARAAAGTTKTTSEARESKAPALQSILSAGRSTLG